MNTELLIEESTITLARALIQRASVTPNDNGCQKIIRDELEKVGFICEQLDFEDVSNLWARYGTQEPLLVFAGHTDVVPTGPLDQWDYPPFSASTDNGLLHGRGASDMKGSIAAMVTASQRFAVNSTKANGSLGFLITSDEEGPAINGTRHALTELQQRSETIKWCIVGEPTSRRRLGDTIKNGRRGSLNGVLNIYGVQGHVAYPQLADNPIHRSSPLISELTNYKWDDGSIDFPPTSFQISNISSGTGALNVIPGDIRILFNFRFSPESTVADLQNKVESICKHHCDHYTIEWSPPSPVYHTPKGILVDTARDVITKVTGIKSDLATDGGTSDGRFIAQTGAEVIELGPVNDTIHSAKERVRIADLTELSKIYEGILNSLLG